MKKLLFTIMALITMASCNDSSQSTSAPQADEAQAIDNVMMSRRSIRQFTSQTISRDTLDQILQCGVNAPNGQGRQAYEIRVVNDPELIAQFSDAVVTDNPAMGTRPDSKGIFNGAPCVIFLANDTTYDMSQVDCGLLGENIILKAWSMGIGSCCMAHPVRLIKDSPTCAPLIKKLEVSEGYNLLYAIVLGYPDETPDARERKYDKIKFIEQ